VLESSATGAHPVLPVMAMGARPYVAINSSTGRRGLNTRFRHDGEIRSSAELDTVRAQRGGFRDTNDDVDVTSVLGLPLVVRFNNDDRGSRGRRA